MKLGMAGAIASVLLAADSGVIRSLTGTAAPLGASAASAPVQPPPGILAFYPTARDRAAKPPDEKKLTVSCQRQLRGANVPAGYAGLWISFLGADPGRVLIAAFTREQLVDPVKVITLHVRYGPLPTAMLGPQGTLDWGYLYDRNADGRADYLVYLQNAHPVLPDPLPADFPKVERAPGGKIRASMPLLNAMLEHGQMIFRHYADDDFDGKVDAGVIEEFDTDRPLFVKDWLAFRASRPGGEVDEAWAFRGAIDDRQRVLERGADGFLVSLAGEAPLAIGTLFSRASERLGVINAALAECKLDAASLERGDR